MVVDTADIERVAEALRAAVGLGLRGDPVRVVVTEQAEPATAVGDPRIARALATLVELGQTVDRAVPPTDVGTAARAASPVEVWT